MDVRILAIELAEKIGLLATAGLVCVLFPPLRDRLLGVAQPRDRLVGVALGIVLAMWGAKMGETWLGLHVNVRAIGVFIAAILGGVRGGLVAGLAGGAFYVFRVDDSLGAACIIASVLNGTAAGIVVDRAPQLFQGWRAFPTALAVQLGQVLFVGIGLLAVDEPVYLTAWPAQLLQAFGNAAGVTMFAVTARVVLQREEDAVALVQARAAADAMALEALRRRLEPHFLFNALNTLRATIRTNPILARELVLDLADLYRYLLHHPEDAPLEDEVAHAEDYLAIERARLGADRLRVEKTIAEEVRRLRVPALLLQPLVENAVKHGVAAKEGEGLVRVVAQQDGPHVVLEVEDRSEGRAIGKVDAGSGIALSTLRERLAKRYGAAASLELLPTEHGMRAIVKLPLGPLRAEEGTTERTAA